MHESTKALVLDRIASIVTLATLILLPLFFIPFFGFGVEIGKTYLVGFGMMVGLILWLIARMVQGTIVLPKTPLMLVALSMPVTFLISALFSPSWPVSLAGLSISAGTVIGMLILVLVFFTSLLYLSSERRVTLLVKGLFVVTGLVTLFQVIYWIIGPKILNLGTFTNVVSNMIGRWYDFGVWYGLVLIIAMLVYTYVSLSRRSKIATLAAGIVALIMLILVNIPTVWAVVGFISLLIFTYGLLRERGEDGIRFPVIPLALLVISLLCFLAYPLIGSVTVGKLSLSQMDVRPSVSSTGHVLIETVKHHPILGVGPNRFSNAWNEYQPASIIRSNYWNVSFSSGSGFLPTIPVTVGILGTISVILFLVLFFMLAIANVFRKNDSKTHFYILGSFVSALYLWIIAFVSTPGIVVLTGAFVASGICVGILYASGRIPSREIHFLKDPRMSFFMIVGLVVLLLGACYALFVGAEKFISLTLYSRAQNRIDANDPAQATFLLTKAEALYPADLYGRALTTASLARLSLLLQNKNLSPDILKSEFKNIFTDGEAYAQQALVFDRSNPDNWINLGLFYQNVISLQVTGAYDNAKAAFDQAGKLAPRNPDIDLYRAKLEMLNKNNDAAITIIKAALEKKPNFVNGIFLLAQLEAASGNTDEAIAGLEAAVSRDPRNASLYLALGIFKYDNKDYQGAVSALERSITLDSSVPNTRYLLGLAYAKTGKRDDARVLFVSLKNAFPNNENLVKIIENLDSGKDPLDGLSPSDTQLQETNQTEEADPKPTAKQTSPKPKQK
jgi:cytochrome c-type biogenesis protein CcmH/NrfG